ncbi:Response regulator [hydrothermal vent metagenome]|uniref:Response regulator n=1 Tax=hydrothermal vent metagenome TaxID=652676 RepID=A0A3B0V0A1_9ZZZZ
MQLNYQILIVDDISENIQIAMNILKELSYDFAFALNGTQALQLMQQNDYDLILLDVMMPEMSGFEVCKRMQQNSKLMDIPVIFLTARVDIDSISTAFRIGGNDFISKPFHPEELLARVSTHLELYSAKRKLQHQNKLLENQIIVKESRLSSEIEMNQKEMIGILTELMEVTSDETGLHLQRVAEISKLLASYHESMSAEEISIIYHAAPMHDIGKIAIPLSILHNPNQLSPDERTVMQTHTTLAARFLKHSKRKFIKAASIIALQHHEKWDGSGYPNGLKGEEIHIFGRIVALADVLDALTHERKYKKAWSIEDSIKYIKKGKGTHFDPDLVDILLDHLDEFTKIINS